jgi:hypothetical protein
MHIPKKHRVEDVEKAMKEAEEHLDEELPEPGVKIVINLGAPPVPHRKPMRHKVVKAKAKKKSEKKAKTKGGKIAGEHESALGGMY